MMRSLFVCLLWAGISCSTALHAATFNVTNSDEFTAALATASSNNEDNTINLAAGTYSSNSGFTYTGTNHALALTGAGKDSTFISASNSIGISFTFSGTITVSQLTVQDVTQSAHYTGFKFAEGSGSDFNVVIHDCNFSHLGDGAIQMTDSTLSGSVSIHDNLFEYNHALTAGGALSLIVVGFEPFPVQIKNNIFNYNSATQDLDNSGGGAVRIINFRENSPVTLSGNIFDHNVSSLGTGGGAYIYTTSGSSGITVGGSGEGDGNVFSYNDAIAAGGIYINSGGAATLMGNTLEYNSATDFGGQGGGAMIGYTSGVGEFSNNIVRNNTADSSGGLSIVTVEGYNPSFNMNANLISGNSANDCGGANIFFPGLGSSAVMTNNIIVGNHGSEVGGVFIGESVSQDIYLINNTFAGNDADYFVGGLSVLPGAAEVIVNLDNNIFWKNTSTLPSKDVWVQQANPAWGGMNFFNNDVVNDTSVPDPEVASNICIDDPNDSYTSKCNHGRDFSTLPNTTVSRSSNPYALYDIDPGFLAEGDLVDQYSLTVSSLMIQAGTAAVLHLPQFDYTGTVPMDTPNPDLGALQYCVPNLSMTITPNSNTITLGDNITWTVALNNSANCSSNDNTLTLTFANSEFESAGQASASLSRQLASVLHSSSASVSCSGAGTNATCTIARIPNASSVNLSVVGSTQSIGDIGLSATLTNAVGTASASGSASAMVVPLFPGDLSGAGCALSGAETNSVSMIRIYSLLFVLLAVREKKLKGRS